MKQIALPESLDELFVGVREVGDEVRGLKAQFAKSKTYHAAVLVQNRLALRKAYIEALRSKIRCAVNNSDLFEM